MEERSPVSSYDEGSNGRNDHWIYRTCPLCDGHVPEGSGRPVPDRDGGLVEFRACPTCRTLFPSGSNAVAGTDQETTRQADYHKDLWQDVNLEQLDLLAATAGQLAWELAEHLEAPGHSGFVVDIGAGRGNILHALARLGYDVRGCEPSSFLCQVARAAYLLGPDVLANCDAEAHLRAMEERGERPAGFIIWHVLEHLREPLALLRRCRRLSPTGMLFIELPIAQAEDIFPEHLFFPTPASLIRLADTLGLSIRHLSVTEDRRLRVFYRGVDPTVFDLDDGPVVDLEALEAAYRSLSPAFAHHFPGEAAVEEAEVASGRRGD
jgi:SAM-dependent methyltransferase